MYNIITVGFGHFSVLELNYYRIGTVHLHPRTYSIYNSAYLYAHNMHNHIKYRQVASRIGTTRLDYRNV